MASLAKLVVELGFDGSGFESGLNKVGGKLKSFGSSMTMGVTLPVLAAGAASVKMASDLSEAMSLTDQVFVGSAEKVQKWATTMATSFGVSRTESLTYANQLGLLLTNMGFTDAAAADMSMQMVQLAADMASAANVPVADALNAIRSGLVGETEPLKQFGVNLNEAAIKAEALRLGLYSGTGELSANAKAQAALSIVMQQTTKMQGNFALTAEGAANQTKILRAQLADAGATLGTQLLPHLVTLLGTVNGLIAGYGELSPRQKKLVEGLIVFAAVVGPLAVVIGFIITNLTAFGAALGVIIAPLTAVVGILILFAPIIVPLTALFGILNRAFGVSVNDILRAAQRLWGGFSSTVRNIVGSLGDLKNTISETASSILETLIAIKDDAWNAMYDAGYAIGEGLIAGINAIWDSVVNFAGDLADAVYDKIKGALDIFSPSGKGEYLGEMLGAGLMRGMANAERGVTSAAGSMAGAALSGMSTYNGGINISVSGAGDPNAVADRVFATFTRELGLRNA